MGWGLLQIVEVICLVCLVKGVWDKDILMTVLSAVGLWFLL